MYSIVLNKNKSIGKVVFVVEGDKKEHTLLGHIFEKILDYSIVDVRKSKEPYSKYVSKKNRDSRVFVITANSSNIKAAGSDGREYLDQVFTTLYRKYALDISNAAVYYLFDRDNESNLFCEAEKLTGILKNSRDNGIDMNGLLLINYPSVEAYIKTCIDDCICEYTDTPKSLKRAVNDSRYQYNKIDADAIVRASICMLNGIDEICGRGMTEADLDDFSEIGDKVLSEENHLYLDNKKYMILSLLSVAFIDLGILRVSTWG